MVTTFCLNTMRFLQNFAEQHSDQVVTLITVFGRVKEDGISKLQILLIEKSQLEGEKYSTFMSSVGF